MRLILSLYRFLILFLLAFLSAGNASAQDSGDLDFGELIGKKVDVKTKKKFLSSVEVMEITPAKSSGGLLSLRVMPKDSKRPVRVSAVQVEEIYLNESPLDVTYDRKLRCLVLDPEKRAARLAHRKKVEGRLALMRHRLWTPLSEDQHEQFMQKHREFLEDTQRRMPLVRFRLVETKFFLFLTDLPPNQVDGYIAQLDSMYEMLCSAFAIPPDKNIWCGKCVVVTFQSEHSYLMFEQIVMKNSEALGTQGLCHQYSDGTVVFAGFQGAGGLGHVLVHETSHGFVHRYISTARVPSWLNEGIADWLAEAVVKSKRTLAKQKRSAVHVMARKGWGDFLTVEKINHEHYGSASAVVEILRSLDKKGTQFKIYFDAMKEGTDPEQALVDAFGIGYRELEVLYSRRITSMGR